MFTNHVDGLVPLICPILRDFLCDVPFAVIGTVRERIVYPLQPSTDGISTVNSPRIKRREATPLFRVWVAAKPSPYLI